MPADSAARPRPWPPLRPLAVAAALCAGWLAGPLVCTTPSAAPAAAVDQTIAVFDEEPVEFARDLAEGTRRGEVQLFRTGQQIERTLELPALPADMRDAQRIVATLIIDPVIVQQDDKVRPSDPWTRLGSVTIGMENAPADIAPAIAPPPAPPTPAATAPASTRPAPGANTAAAAAPASQPDDGDDSGFPVTTAAPGEIEIMRFVTPFGGPATYTADLTAFAPLLAGRTSLRVWISTWRQPAWNVTLTLRYTDQGAGYRRPRFAHALFNSQITAETSRLRKTITIPKGLARPRLHLLSTGHATDGTGGDEFISRTHILRVDGVEVARWRPWSEAGGPLRGMNPTSGRTDIAERSLWASDLDRSGWHPGLLVEPLHLPLPELTPGRHTVELEIVNIRARDQSGYGYWRISAIVVADEPWPNDDGPGPQEP